MLITLCEDGKLRNETLSRLPKWVQQRDDVSIIHGMMDTVHIVINRASQRCYSHEDLHSTPPVIIERERSSIPHHGYPYNFLGPPWLPLTDGGNICVPTEPTFGLDNFATNVGQRFSYSGRYWILSIGASTDGLDRLKLNYTEGSSE